MTSAVVTSLNSDKGLNGLDVMTVGGAVAVAVRIVSTLFRKKVAKSSAEWTELDDAVDDTISNALTFDQSALESPRLFLKTRVQ